MAAGTGRLLARTLRDVTSVTGEELRAECFSPRLVSEVENEVVRQPATCHVICIASGKGGTGKTVVTTNLSIALAQEGLRVVLFDADMGLANAHLLMGVTPTADVSAILEGRARMEGIVVECPAGVKLVSGGSGFAWLAELPVGTFRTLAEGMASLEASADVMLVDAAAGIGPQVMRFLRAAHEVLVVTTPDATALLDAYALIKSLAQKEAAAFMRIIVNRARDRAEAVEAFKKLQAVAGRHLAGTALSFFGWIPQHWYIQESVRERSPVLLMHPKSFVAASLRSMASALRAMHGEWAACQRRPPSILAGVADGTVLPFSMRLAQGIFG